MEFRRIIRTVGILLFLLFANIQTVASAATTAPAASKSIPNVPMLVQTPELPTGCEATALTMLLQWEQIKVDKVTVAHAFPQLPVPTYENGKWVGGNPNAGYVGDPTTNTGYGVYHHPVAVVLDHYLPNRALDLTGQSFSQLIAAVASGRPVLAWIPDQLQEPAQKKLWYDQTGQAVNWIGPEHVVVMTGYTEKTITVNDPETGKVLTYPRQMFELRWEQMGKQAVTVTQAPAASSEIGKATPGVAVKSHPIFQQLTIWKQDWAQVVLFLKKNKSTMWESYAIVFVVICISYYFSLSFVTLLKKRKQRNQTID